MLPGPYRRIQKRDSHLDNLIPPFVMDGQNTICKARSHRESGRKGSKMNFDNQKMRNFENRIVETLRNEGIEVEAEEVEIVKNGILCKAIRIRKEGSNICPVVYYSEQDTYEQFILRIRSALESDVPRDSIKLLNDLNYVRNNVFLAVQKQSKEEIVKKEYLNLELFMRIMLDLGGPSGAGSVKVTPGLVAQLSITEDDLWDYAAANSLKEAIIRNMAEILGLPDADDEQSLYVATTGQLTGGASVLLLVTFYSTDSPFYQSN